MHHSLEVRVPLLDPDLIATSLRISPSWTLSRPQTKPVLRTLLERRLGTAPPAAKLGFGAPIASWLTGDLREPVADALTGPIGPVGLIDERTVDRLWVEQLAGDADHRALLWGLASLSWWHRRVAAF